MFVHWKTLFMVLYMKIIEESQFCCLFSAQCMNSANFLYKASTQTLKHYHRISTVQITNRAVLLQEISLLESIKLSQVITP